MHTVYGVADEENTMANRSIFKILYLTTYYILNNIITATD